VELRRDLLLGVGSLFGLNLVLAFATIAVFMRMGPVTDRMSRENVVALEAGEQMLALMTEAGAAPFDATQRRLFTIARGRAAAALAGPAADGPIGRLVALEDAIAAGTMAARQEAIVQLRGLSATSRADLEAGHREARRLGLAGAWFAVFVASIALILGVIAVRRLTHRLLVPIRELWATLEAAHAGNIYRRCAVAQAPLEIGRIVHQVNEMLDLRSSRQPYTERRSQVDRAVVLWALRQRKEATFVVDERGQIFAANAPAHALLGEPAGASVRAALAGEGGPARAAARMPTGFEVAVEPLPEGNASICEVRKKEAGV
jgi:nitrogen fixation/metabolism regulation signal transduction histidine kinase